ncbi:MAG: polyhydroxyalkanoate synthesis repressor PhaR [Pseudomonadales bacterium]
MRQFKKYPNRRLYDLKQSKYVTIEDIRQIVLTGETIVVVDSKSDKDLTRSVLLQIISERESEGKGEGEGEVPILTNPVLEQLIRFHASPARNVLSRFIEQSILTFLDHQEQFRSRTQDVSGTEPLALMRQALERNMEFWNHLAQAGIGSDQKD